MGRVVLMVLDGVGIGAAPDAEEFGDEGADTLGNLARVSGGLHLPALERLGLGCCRPLHGVRCGTPTAAYGVAVPRSAGKDSTAGHWELCGIVLERAFPTYPGGFPQAVVDGFAAATGRPVLGNKPASGQAVLDDYGPAHLESGGWIVYTSVDSVFQVAAHVDRVPLEELYAACRFARERLLVGEHAVSRVIARPFTGVPGAFRRTPNRRDFSVPPPRPTLLDRLADAGVPRVGVGKVDDLFAGRGIESTHPEGNAAAYRRIAELLEALPEGLLFANVVEFDQSWGHRNDAVGFTRGLEELDAALPFVLDRLRERDLLILTADHGNDPTGTSTDHSRELVPLLVCGPRVEPVALGDRATLADVGATIARYFGVEILAGTSFLEEVASWMP